VESQEQAIDEGVSLGSPALPGSGDVAVAEGDDRRVESQVEPDAEAGERQVQVERMGGDDDGDDKAPLMVTTVRELDNDEEEEEEEEEGGQNDHEGEGTTEEVRLVDQASDIEPPPNEQDPTHPEPQLVSPITSAVEPERDEPSPSYAESQLADLATNNFEPSERTEHDPKRSAQPIATLRTNIPLPPQTTPTIKQLYPKDGLGATIELTSNTEHRFIIDSLDPPTATTTQQRAVEPPCPEFPESLAKLQEADLADTVRAGHMSTTAHKVLADRLWRTVAFANYFSDRQPTSSDLPPGSQSISLGQQRFGCPVPGSKSTGASRPSPLHQAAVENAVLLLLSRTKNDSEHLTMNKFTRANRAMAMLLHAALAEERVVTRKDLFEMFAETYGRGGEEGVNWRVDLTELGVLFDGKGNA
jgi:hypothetical protein